MIPGARSAQPYLRSNRFTNAQVTNSRCAFFFACGECSCSLDFFSTRCGKERLSRVSPA
jgi:hypothetical protein